MEQELYLAHILITILIIVYIAFSIASYFLRRELEEIENDIEDILNDEQ